MIGLYEKRLVFQHVQKQASRCVNHKVYAFSVQPLQHTLIDIRRQCARHGARKHQIIAGFDLVKLFEQFFNFAFGNVGTLRVDIQFGVRLDFNIDSCASAFQPVEIAVDRVVFQHAFKCVARKARDKAERLVFNAEPCEDHGYVDAFAAVIQRFLFGTVDVVKTERSDLHHVIQRRIQGYCVNHVASTSLMTVFDWISGSVHLSQMMHDASIGATVTADTLPNLEASVST